MMIIIKKNEIISFNGLILMKDSIRNITIPCEYCFAYNFCAIGPKFNKKFIGYCGPGDFLTYIRNDKYTK